MMFLLLGLAIFAIPLTYFTGQSYALGSDYFSINSGSNNYPVGQTFNVEISETSSDNVNAESAVLNYPASLLTLNSITLNGPFTLCGNDSGSGGSINISCAVPDNTVTGTQQIANLNFTPTVAGVSTIDFTSGTAISNSSQVNSWNGVYPSANYTIYQPAPTPQPTSTVNTSTPSSTASTPHYYPSSSSATTSNTPSPQVTSPTKVLPKSTVPKNTQVAYINTTKVIILVENQKNNQYINLASVSISGYKSELTNKQGQVVFNKVSIGMHNITVSYPGIKTLTKAYKIMPNSSAQKIIISLNLASNNQTRLVAYIVSLVVVLSIIGAIIIHYLKNLRTTNKKASSLNIDEQQVIKTAPQSIINNNSQQIQPTSYQPQIIRPTNLEEVENSQNLSTNNNSFFSTPEPINKINNEEKQSTVSQNYQTNNNNMIISKPKVYVTNQPQAIISNNSINNYENNNINHDEPRITP